MKNTFAVLLITAMVLSLWGCHSTKEASPPTAAPNPGDTGKESEIQVPWRAQYIRTDGASAAVLYPSVRIIHSLQQLQDYYNTWHEVFDLARRERGYADTTPGFLDACDLYDEAFFEDRYLIFLLLEEGSGSVRHQVRSVTQTEDQKLRICVDREIPQVGTDDMAQWHIILELGRDVLVENSIDTLLFVEGLPAYMDDRVVIPQTEGAFKQPPKGTLITAGGEAPLLLAGYSWFCRQSNGLEMAIVTDQASRPLPKDSLSPVAISSQYEETVYAPVPGSHIYAPTNSLGYLMKLSWQEQPSSVTYTCWPEAIWSEGSTPQETVVSHEGFSFYAKPGGYIYEVTATWDDIGTGYHGNAIYYVYIVGGQPKS